MAQRSNRLLPTVLASLSLALLAACSHHPIRFSEATPVSQANRYQAYAAYADPTPGTAHMLVARDPGMGDSPISAVLSVNGTPVARFWTRQKIDLYLPPATYKLTVEAGFSGFGEPETISATVEGDKTYGYRIQNRRDGGFTLAPAQTID